MGTILETCPEFVKQHAQCDGLLLPELEACLLDACVQAAADGASGSSEVTDVVERFDDRKSTPRLRPKWPQWTTEAIQARGVIVAAMASFSVGIAAVYSLHSHRARGRFMHYSPLPTIGDIRPRD